MAIMRIADAQSDHMATLTEHTAILTEHTAMLTEHTAMLTDQTSRLERIEMATGQLHTSLDAITAKLP
jgi:hypothetical protein